MKKGLWCLLRFSKYNSQSSGEDVGINSAIVSVAENCCFYMSKSDKNTFPARCARPDLFELKESPCQTDHCTVSQHNKKTEKVNVVDLLREGWTEDSQTKEECWWNEDISLMKHSRTTGGKTPSSCEGRHCRVIKAALSILTNMSDTI